MPAPTEYWDVVQFRKIPSGKSLATKIGSAKKRDDGGFILYLNALPMPGPEGCSLSVMPPREQGSYPRSPTGGSARPGHGDPDDEIPF